MAETQKEKLMRLLDITEAEAEDIIASDKAIDKGERVYFDLDPETEKQAKKLINVETHKKSTEKTVRTRKENPTKATIISEISAFLTENGYESVEITNKERQIAFKVGADSFELTLVQKRKPKN
jgi:hypothetical protein